METALTVAGPLDAAGTLARFRLWGEDPANRLHDGVFHRAVRVDGRWWGYTVRAAGGTEEARLVVSVPGARGRRPLDVAVAEAGRIFGLELDLPAFHRAAASDPVLSHLVARLRGLRPTLAPQPFEMLVGSICAQQVNLTFAFTVRRRLVLRYGTPVRVSGQTVYAFPEPAVLGAASTSELRAMQFTTRKSEYIVDLARRVAAGELDLDGLRHRPNEEVIDTLTKVRGFGRWTAEWFLARCLGRGDVCPAGDLGVRKAFTHFYGRRGRALSERAIRRRSRGWGPHQNLAVHYLLAGQRLALAATVGGGT
ncbi:MAG: hypothetical protein L0027_12110 [Candidatus Rokubacteria bacterium]|nr:hypothetical protein [Candidatus Rokubacteria bacterium]